MKQLLSCYLKSTVIFIMPLFMLLFTATKANAQWIKPGGTTDSFNNRFNAGIINNIATDVSGNVYAGGAFTDSNGHTYVAKWNGMAWSELGGTNGGFTGTVNNGQIYGIATDAASNVYAGGWFTNVNGKPYVAKWNGMAWSELGGANAFPFDSLLIRSIAIDPSGNVFAGGGHSNANHKHYVAKWNGTAWSQLGTVPFNGSIISIATDAAGNVYAGGGFSDANGNYYVAKWNGTSWSELGGLSGAFNNSLYGSGTIQSIATDTAGNVYAGGIFSNANGKPYVAKWNGTVWSELGGANDSLVNGFIYRVATDAGGNVYAGGLFRDANSNYYVAKWNGTAWSELGGANSSPFNSEILSIATDAARNVYAGGDFYDSNGKRYVAEYTQALILPAHPNTANATFEFTDNTGWTNYYSNGILLLSLRKNGQNIGTLGDGTFAVTVVATAGAGSNTSIRLTNPLITNSSGYWVMNRYWQVTVTAEPTANVSIRFYYNNQDLADLNGSYSTHNLTNQQLIFYKATGGNPDPTTNLAGVTALVSIMPSTNASNTTWTYHQLTDSTQYAEFSVSSFSGGGGGGTGNDQALPIKIISFTATKQGTGNLLQWTTGQETNSSYFGIERSGDGANFITIRQVSAAGTNMVDKSYSLLDTRPIYGTNYYRLKAVNQDGSFTYSAVRTVNEAISSVAVIYPNPVRNQLSLNFNSDKAKAVQVQIVSSEGKVIITQQLQVAAGASTQNINTTSLSNGAYYIRLISEEGQSELKFVRER